MSGMITIGIGILLISGQIDFSAGATGTVGGLTAAFLLQARMPWFPSVIIAILVGGCVGLILAFVINKLNFMSFIASLAMMQVLAGLGQVATEGISVPISNKSYWAVGSYNFFGVVPLPFFVMLILFIAYGYILNSTKFGRKVYMCGGNSQAARLAGINPKRIHTILFINNGMIACLVGCLLASSMRSASPTALIGTELTGITAAVLGGIAFMGGSGGMSGAFMGLMLLTAFTNGLIIIGLGSSLSIMAQGVLLVAALTLDHFRKKVERGAAKP